MEKLNRSLYPRTDHCYGASRRIVGEGLHLLFNIQKHGIENLDAITGTSAVFAFFPHTGHGDVLVVQHVLQESGITDLFIPGAEDYWFHNPRKLLLANLAIPILPLPRQTKDQGVKKSDIQEAIHLQVDLIKKGSSVLLSPEGTRTNLPAEDRIVRSGFAKLALQTHIPIVPITIVGYEHVLPKGVSIPRPFELTGLPHPDYRKRIDVVVGKPIDTTDCEDNSCIRKAITAHVKDIFLETYNEIKQSYPPLHGKE